MTTLREVRDTLLTIAHPERVLRLADSYLQRFEEFGEDFVLPKEHVIVKPILEHYVGELEGWAKFVKSVRDRLEKRSQEYIEVREFYKVLNVRLIQRRTRALLDTAVELACRKGMIDPSWETKQRYAKRCIQSWKKRKDNMLEAVRKDSPSGRVSLSHREELLHEFWAGLAQEVEAGEIPKP